MSHQRPLSPPRFDPPVAARAGDGAFSVPALHGRKLPARQWLVPDLIPRNAVTLLSGDGGTGKSLLAQQLMSAGSVGRPWLGLELPRFASLGLFCEDEADELHRRQMAIVGHLGCRISDLARMHLWPRAGQDNVLVSFPRYRSMARGTELFDALERLVATNRIELIVIDTAADAFGGHESVRSDVRAFLQRLHALAAYHNGAVLLTSHPSLAGQASGSGLSGSTAWNNSVRSRLYLARPKNEADGDRRELRAMKSNYGPIGARFSLRWREGVFVREEATSDDEAAELKRAQDLAEKFAELVAIAATRGLDLSPNYSSLYAPHILASLPEARGLTSQALAIGMHQALKEELVALSVIGSPSKPRRRLVPIA